MKAEKLTKELQQDNDRITLAHAKRDGYTISSIELYPDDGKHLKCYTDLPCRIEKGRDEFPVKTKWYVMFDTYINIQNKCFSTVTSAINSAKNDYEKYLKQQLKDLQQGKLK